VEHKTLIGLFQKVLRNSSTKLTDSESQQYSVDFFNQRIAELEREYAELTKQPYQAGRLSEIISELGRMWNERLRYEDIDDAANRDGAKGLWQVQNDVSNIVQESKQRIAKAEEPDDRFVIFMEGLLKLRYVLDEWETDN
jgi:hypothetical protein